MKPTDINRKIDLVAAKAKALNLKTSAQFQRAVTRAELGLQKAAEKVSQSAEELAVLAQQLAKQVAPKAVRKQAR